ncbi:MAG: O-antigen ligase family protein [Acidobacteria bacterium]|nr:O-antigen ligase family protein [Acidobacteriota bacterium]
MLSKSLTDKSFIWLLAAPVILNLLLPGEVHVWTKWIVPAAALAVAGAAIGQWLLREDGLLAHTGAPPVAFLVLLALGAVSTLFNRVNYSRSRDMLIMLAAYFVLYAVFRTGPAARALRPVLWMVWGASVFIAVYAVYQYFFLWDGMGSAARSMAGMSAAQASALRHRLAGMRVFSVFALPTTLSDFLALTFPLNVALVLTSIRRPVRMLVTAIPLLVNLWALFLTQSFTGFLSLAFCVGIFYLSGERIVATVRRQWKLTVVLALFFVAAFAFLLYVRKMILVETVAENPLALRMVNWRIGLSAVKDYPMVGVGLDNYQTVYTQYMKSGEHQARHAHSAPIEMMAETGILGGVAFLLLIARWLRRAWHHLRRPQESGPERIGLALAFFAISFQNLLDIGIYFPSQGFLTFMLAGLMDGPAGAGKIPSGIPAHWRKGLAVMAILAGLGAALLCRRLMLAEIAYGEAAELYAAGDTPAAETRVRESIAIDPKPYEPFEMLGSHQLRVGTAAAPAYDSYSQAILRSPLTASLHRGLSLAAAQMGEPLRAYMEARRAAELFPASAVYAADRDRFYDALAGSFPDSPNQGRDR